MVCVEVVVTPTKYPQYTKYWTNVLLKKRLTDEEYQWLLSHVGGQFHVHRLATAIKFENKQDAEWFMLRFL